MRQRLTNCQKVFYWGCVGLILVALHWFTLPFGIVWTLQEPRCLPDMHAAFFVRHAVKSVDHGELVLWKPAGSLSYVKAHYVMKMVAGKPGDHLQITDTAVIINGVAIAKGFPLLPIYHKQLSQIKLNTTIPKGKCFVIGTHPLSDDSRYWGYLRIDDIIGTANKIF